jgi:hypothetical protein
MLNNEEGYAYYTLNIFCIDNRFVGVFGDGESDKAE